MDRVVGCLARSAQGLRSDERGSFLIETLVAAVLVAVIAVAMLSAFDGANQASGRTKTRAIAGSLAQTDQERMRSMPVSMLSGLIQSQVKTVNGVKFNVNSTAEWIADDTNNPNCTANGSAGDYMEITSTVSSPTQPALRPIVVKSIVTPAPGTLGINQGSLAVTVVDRRGKGVPDLTVTINGPTFASDITDANGCAFFGYEPVGNYDVQTSRGGWVDVMGRPYAKTTASIASQQVSTKSLTYDQAGSATVTFATHATDYAPPPTNTTARDVQPPDPAAVATRIRVSHGNMEPPYVRDGAAPLGSAKWGSGNPETQIVADSLFPFGDMTASPQLTSPYRIWAGDCDSTDPNSQSTAQTSDIVQIEPGKATPVTVWLPALNIHVTQSGNPLGGADVKITSAIAGCGGPWTYKTNAAGNLDFPGLPYGSYNVCVDDNKSPSRFKQTTTAIVNAKRTGTLVQTFDIPASGGSTGSC
jgi:Tfp pilus assembly protein PilV